MDKVEWRRAASKVGADRDRPDEHAQNQNAQRHSSPEPHAGAELPTLEDAVGLEADSDGMSLPACQAELLLQHPACAGATQGKGQLSESERIDGQHGFYDRALRMHGAWDSTFAHGRGGC